MAEVGPQRRCALGRYACARSIVPLRRARGDEDSGNQGGGPCRSESIGHGRFRGMPGRTGHGLSPEIIACCRDLGAALRSRYLWSICSQRGSVAPAGAAAAGAAVGAGAVAAAGGGAACGPAAAARAARRRSASVCAASVAAARRRVAAVAAGGTPAGGVAACATAAGGAVGRGLVATLSTSSSDSSPSVELHPVRLHFGHEQTVDLLAGLHAPRLVAGNLAQEGRALAIDQHGAGQRELAALQPFGASLRHRRGRAAGRIEKRALHRLCARGHAALDREFRQERCHDRLWRDRLRRRRVRFHGAAPVGLPADHRRESGERKEPPEGRSSLIAESAHGLISFPAPRTQNRRRRVER